MPQRGQFRRPCLAVPVLQHTSVGNNSVFVARAALRTVYGVQQPGAAGRCPAHTAASAPRHAYARYAPQIRVHPAHIHVAPLATEVGGR